MILSKDGMNTLKRRIMGKIIKVWFKDGRIYIETDLKETLSRSLIDFPILLNATNAERADYRIVHNGEALRWDNIDEDIHVSSFYRPDNHYDNEIAKIFVGFPQLNVKQFAKIVGINYTLLSNYINGSKKPSPQKVQFIKESLHNLGNELLTV